MKISFWAILLSVVVTIGCNTTKRIKTGATGITNGDSGAVSKEDPMLLSVRQAMYHDNVIPFSTFSAKVKVSYEDQGGKQPDVNAFIRMKKDEAIWISVAATFLNIEAYRVLITPDSVVVINKMEKTIEQYPITFVKDRLSIPVDFNDLQRLIAGKVVLTGDSLTSVNQTGDFVKALVTMPGIYNQIYFTYPGLLLAKQVVQVSQLGDNFTVNALYDDYEKTSAGLFSITRNITIPEKNQKLQLTFKQYEFNKELSLPFNRPDGYDIK